MGKGALKATTAVWGKLIFLPKLIKLVGLSPIIKLLLHWRDCYCYGYLLLIVLIMVE